MVGGCAIFTQTLSAPTALGCDQLHIAAPQQHQGMSPWVQLGGCSSFVAAQHCHVHMCGPHSGQACQVQHHGLPCRMPNAVGVSPCISAGYQEFAAAVGALHTRLKHATTTAYQIKSGSSNVYIQQYGRGVWF
jgi:hypothetical protein